MKLQFKIINKKYFKILFSMAIIISLGVALLFGLINGISSVHKSVDNFISNNNYPDIKIITNLEDNSLLEEINVKGIKSINTRLNISTTINKDDEIISVSAITYDDKNINDFYIIEEAKNTSNFYDMLIEKKFADNNDIHLGDEITLKIDDSYYKFNVSKIISTPEAMASEAINGLWGQLSDYGNVYINKKVLVDETNKLKNKLLKEIEKNSDELKNIEKEKLKEYYNAKKNIDDVILKYNKQKASYTSIKNKLKTKIVELNNQKEKLLTIKNKYIEIMDYIYNIDTIIDRYINSYNALSDNAKEYINNIIEKKFPAIKIEDLEFISDIGYNIVENKINELFNQDSNINKKIKNKIEIIDSIKSIINQEYIYFNSSEVNNLVEEIKSGVDVKNKASYIELKNRLELYNVYGLLTDDNIIYAQEFTKTILNELHALDSKMPFNTANDLYNFLDNARVLLPFLYDSLKSEYIPILQEKIDKYNDVRTKLKEKVESIYNENKKDIEKITQIKKYTKEYIENIINETIIEYLKDYTNETNDSVVAIIDKLINKIDNGIIEISNNIDSISKNISSASNLINKSKKELNENYNKLLTFIKDTNKEINDKKEEINSIKGYESKFNEINIKVKDSVDKESILEKIKNDDLKNIEIKDSYTYDYSPVHNMVKSNIVGMENVTIILPAIFYTITLIILFLFISLIIKESKNEIAIFRLLGISKNKIRTAYLLNNSIISIIGITIGLILGYLLMLFIVNYYEKFLLLPYSVYEINPLSIILCIVSTIIVVEISTLLATLELDKITPIQVLNKEKYQNKDISKFIKYITNFLSPLKKFSFIVYIRNKKNLILGIICTSFTAAIIFTSFAYVTSKDKIFNEYFDDRINYDAQIFKKGIIDEEYVKNIRQLEYVEKADILKYYYATIKGKNNEKKIVINALNNENDYIKIFDKNKNEIEYPSEGIVLEEHIANELGVKQNDIVYINDVPFKIENISFQSMGRINYIPLKDKEKLDSYLDTIVLKMDNNRHKDLIKQISNDNNYLYTVNYDSLREYNKKEFDSYVIPAIIIIAFSMISGFIIVINIYNYNLIDQKRNLSIFRSLGFNYREISKNLFIQSLIQWISSLVIGLPIGIALSIFALKQISSNSREYIYASGINEMIITALLIFAYILISHLIIMKKIKKINIIEEIKDSD